MNYQIRTATKSDLPIIERIYARAREFMAQTGNPNQWGKTNPPTPQLEQDIQEKTLFVVTDGSDIHGVFYFAIGEDPTYQEIYEGSWGSDAPYGTIHRIASDGSGGIFSAAVAYCKTQIHHLRIDTHQDNRIMQHVVTSHGFIRRGIIYIQDGSPRIAYEWMK